MSYIGKTPATGDFVKLDAITTSSTNTYNLLKDSVAFTPESANHMIVSLNGVIQAPLTAFTVSGSTITFIPSSGTLSSSDSIDFILVLGNVLDIGTPSDDTISASKLKTDSVITAKIQDDAVTKAKVNFISDATAGVEVKGDGGSNDGYIQLNCSQNSHGVKIKSPPHSAGQSYTLTLPQSITNDYYLKTDGSGNLSFAQVSSDVVKILDTNAGGSSSIQALDSIFSATYKYYMILANIKLASTGNMEWRFQDSSNAEISSAYYFSGRQSGRNNSSSIGGDMGAWNSSTFSQQENINSSYFGSYRIFVFDPYTSTTHTNIQVQVSTFDGSVQRQVLFSGFQGTAATHAGIRFISDQNMTSDSNFKVYGYK